MKSLRTLGLLRRPRCCETLLISCFVASLFAADPDRRMVPPPKPAAANCPTSAHAGSRAANTFRVLDGSAWTPRRRSRWSQAALRSLLHHWPRLRLRDARLSLHRQGNITTDQENPTDEASGSVPCSRTRTATACSKVHRVRRCLSWPHRCFLWKGGCLSRPTRYLVSQGHDDDRIPIPSSLYGLPQVQRSFGDEAVGL